MITGALLRCRVMSTFSLASLPSPALGCTCCPCTDHDDGLIACRGRQSRGAVSFPSGRPQAWLCGTTAVWDTVANHRESWGTDVRVLAESKDFRRTGSGLCDQSSVSTATSSSSYSCQLDVCCFSWFTASSCSVSFFSFFLSAFFFFLILWSGAHVSL